MSFVLNSLSETKIMIYMYTPKQDKSNLNFSYAIPPTRKWPSHTVVPNVLSLFNFYTMYIVVD